jgi:ABC-type antimicrobial peptide transport system permease subunit
VALGADRVRITTLVLRRGLQLVAAGEAAGMLVAMLLNRAIAGLLFHVSAIDPLTYVTVAAVWTTVGLAACYVPARRAVQVDPMTALRSE